MATSAEPWYVRLPDGRVVRADPTFLRRQLSAGRMPHGVEARRSTDDAWRRLDSFDEFRDLRPGSGTVSSRLDPAALRFVGARALLEELAAALDGTMAAPKLSVAALGGVAAGVLLMLPLFVAVPPWAVAGGVALLALVQAAILSRMTFHELSRLRPARVRDGLGGVVGLVASMLFSVGLVAAALIAVRACSPLLTPLLADEWAWTIDVAVLAVTLLLGALLVYLAPLPAAMVVEETSLVASLAGWWRLTCGRTLTVFASQWLALVIGLLLAGPVWLLTLASPHPVWAALVHGLTGSVVAAYLAVANVFLYLHFRYAGR